MDSRTNRKRFTSQMVFTFCALVSVPLAGMYTVHAIKNQDSPPIKEEAEAFPKVSVINAISKTRQVVVRGHGEAQPHYALTLLSQVEGSITEIQPLLERGKQLKTGQVLAHVDPIDYEQAYASAKLTLAEARLVYQEEQQEADRALKEWQKSGLDGQASELLLREPQLAIAEAGIEQAKAELSKAKKDLSNTQIKTPFDSIVVERLVSPGQYVQIGDSIATLHSTDRIDIRVSIPIQKWSMLPEHTDLIGTQGVKLWNNEGIRWEGRVTQVDQHIDTQTRQRSVVVSVFEPNEQGDPLLPGTFLNVELPGKSIDGVVAVPASSLSSRGDIWHVDDANQLQRFVAEIAFKESGTLYLKNTSFKNNTSASQSITDDKAFLVLTSPSPGLVAGQTIEPVYSTEADAAEVAPR